MIDPNTIKEGSKLYVPNKQKAQYGDKIIGGIATVTLVRRLSSGIHVNMKETTTIQWNLEALLRKQDDLKKEFGDKIAEAIDEPFERDNFIW